MKKPLPVEALLEALLRAVREGDARTHHVVSALEEHDPHRVAFELGGMLERSLGSLWERGWQPADLMRVTEKDRGRSQVEILRLALASQACSYEQWGTAVAPRWMAQLEAIGAVPHRDPASPWPLRVRSSLQKAVLDGMELLVLVGQLPPLPPLMPPPSLWPHCARTPETEVTRLEPGMLAKVRALLAKAESTDFDAEADSFTAKAQELMTRYRIDRAALAAAVGVRPGRAEGRRLGVENPYARAKALLVGGIARANSCRAVWSQAFGFATVFGSADDLDAVEELYTSLLVQAMSALRREGSKVDRLGRSRTARFRRSFLLGFAARISARLQEATADTVGAVARETGRDLEPILDSRERAAEEAMRSVHSKLRGMSVSISDGEGYRAGTRVADQADLRRGPQEVESQIGGR